jgi:hypothetical protein
MNQLQSFEIDMEETLFEKDAIVSTLKERVACGKVRRCYQARPCAMRTEPDMSNIRSANQCSIEAATTLQCEEPV